MIPLYLFVRALKNAMEAGEIRGISTRMTDIIQYQKKDIDW
jgi:hypothetical protein